MSQLHDVLPIVVAPFVNENGNYTHLDAPADADTRADLSAWMDARYAKDREITRQYGYLQGNVALAPFGQHPVSDGDMVAYDAAYDVAHALVCSMLTGTNYLSGSVTIRCSSGGVRWASTLIDSALRSVPINPNDRPGLGDP